MKTVDQIINDTIGIEGGYSNNPKDKGGPTKFGITEQVARAHGYTGDMKDLLREVAVSIFKETYWVAPKFDQVAIIDLSIATKLFDAGVNMGPNTSSKFLQRALNVLNKEATAYPDIYVDGQIGNMSLLAFKSFLTKRGSEGLQVLLKMLNALQSVRYIEIAEAKSSQEEFEYGWQLNRIQ